MEKISVHQYEEWTITDIGDLDASVIFQDLLIIQTRESSRRRGIQPFVLSRSHTDSSLRLKAGDLVGIVTGQHVILEILPKKSLRGISLNEVMFMMMIGQTGQGFGSTSGAASTSLAQSLTSDSLTAGHLFAIPFLELATNLINSSELESEFSRVAQTSAGEIRGILNIERQATALDKTRFEVDRIMRTLDTEENRTVKFTVLRILETGMISDDGLRSQCRDILEQLSEVPDAAPEELLFQRDNAYPSPIYDELLGMAGIILQGVDPDLIGSSVSLPNWLVDLNLVFERHVCVGLMNLHNYYEEFTELGVEYQPQFSTGVMHFGDNHSVEELPKSQSYIEPDGIIKSQSDWHRIVIDAKNKFSPLSDDAFGVANQDLYQIYYYAKRLGCFHCILIYPGVKSQPKEDRYLMFDGEILFTRYTIPVTGSPSAIVKGLTDLGKYCYSAQVESTVFSTFSREEEKSFLTKDRAVEIMEELGLTGKDAQKQILKILRDRMNLMRTPWD